MKNGIKILIFVYPIFCKDIHKMMISNHSLPHPECSSCCNSDHETFGWYDRTISRARYRSLSSAPGTSVEMLHLVHSFMLSFQDFLCPSLVCPPSTVPWRITCKGYHDVLHVCACNMSWFLIQRRYYFYLVGNN